MAVMLTLDKQIPPVLDSWCSSGPLQGRVPTLKSPLCFSLQEQQHLWDLGPERLGETGRMGAGEDDRNSGH